MHKEWSKAISMLVAMETDDSPRRGAIMVITKKFGLAHAEQNVCELSVIDSPALFFMQKTQEEQFCTP